MTQVQGQERRVKQKFRSLKDIDDAYILQIHVLCGWNKDANELVQSFLTSHVHFLSVTAKKTRKQSPNKEMLPAPCLPFRSAFQRYFNLHLAYTSVHPD